jgi:hypothetical protein
MMFVSFLTMMLHVGRSNSNFRSDDDYREEANYVNKGYHGPIKLGHIVYAVKLQIGVTNHCSYHEKTL